MDLLNKVAILIMINPKVPKNVKLQLKNALDSRLLTTALLKTNKILSNKFSIMVQSLQSFQYTETSSSINQASTKSTQATKNSVQAMQSKSSVGM